MHTSLPEQETPTGAVALEQERTLTPRMTVALAFMIGCVTLMMTGFAIIIPVYPQRLQELGLGPETLAWMEGVFGLGMFIFSPLMGTWSGRIGRKPILLISLGGFIVTNIALAFVGDWVSIIVVRFIEGVLLSGLMPTAMSMVGDSVPGSRQGRWLGYITTAQAVGFAIGPAIGGPLYQYWGFHAPFLLSAGIALLASIAALFLIPETISAEAKEHARTANTSKEKLGTSTFWTLIFAFLPLLTIDFGLIFTYPFVFPQYPFHFENVLHFDPTQYGLLISTYGLSLAIFPLLLGGVIDRAPKKLLIVLGAVFFGAFNAGILFFSSYWVILGGAVLSGLGQALVQPVMGTIYLGATTDENRGQVMGIRGSAFSLAVTTGPILQALIAPYITPITSFTIGFIISLFMIFVSAVLVKAPKESAQPQPA